MDNIIKELTDILNIPFTKEQASYLLAAINLAEEAFKSYEEISESAIAENFFTEFNKSRTKMYKERKRNG